MLIKGNEEKRNTARNELHRLGKSSSLFHTFEASLTLHLWLRKYKVDLYFAGHAHRHGREQIKQSVWRLWVGNDSGSGQEAPHVPPEFLSWFIEWQGVGLWGFMTRVSCFCHCIVPVRVFGIMNS